MKKKRHTITQINTQECFRLLRIDKSHSLLTNFFVLICIHFLPVLKFEVGIFAKTFTNKSNMKKSTFLFNIESVNLFKKKT